MSKKPLSMSTKKPALKDDLSKPSRDEIIGSAKGGKSDSKGVGRPVRTDKPRIKGVNIPESLRDELQELANRETAGNFSKLVERAMEEFLADPNFPLGRFDRQEKPKIMKYMNLAGSLIEEIEERARVKSANNFSALTIMILRGYMDKKGHQLPI
jgi:hypothetical protein